MEDTVVDTPAGVLSVENAPAVVSTTPFTPAPAGRRGGRPAAAGSVYHTPAGVDTWCTPVVAHKMSLTPGKGKRGSPSKRRSLLLYHQRKVEEEGLGPSRLQLAATAWQMQRRGLQGGVGRVHGYLGDSDGLVVQEHLKTLSCEHQVNGSIWGAVGHPVFLY